MSNQLEKVKELILKVNIQHVNVSRCCLTKVVSKNLICS